LGWKVVEIDGNYLYIKRLLFVLSIAKLQRPNKKVSVSKLRQVAKKERVVYLLIEPQNNQQYKYFKFQGFKNAKSSSLPTKTIRFNLSKSLEYLLQNMHHKARYNIRLSKRRGVNVKKSKNVENFAEFWQECSKSWGMHFSQRKEIISLYKAFGKESVILNAEFEKEIIASVLLVSSSDTAYYMYAASTEKGNKHQAPSLLVWESIKYAKKRKKKLFDFGGIYDERFPLKKWRGFSEFKRKFGGKKVEFPQPLRKYYLPF
jgi:lipid II:glycine glycyltransferase (peptidoglycan interpeptide bridge formation enzyme)